MDVAAEKATEEPREGIARRKARMAARQIVRMGAPKCWFTLSKKGGRPWSRAKANIILELEVREKRPQCQTQRIMRVIRAMAPLFPKMSIRICVTGWPTGLLTVFGKSWMEKRRDSIRKKPNTPDTPTDISTPRGAFHEALFVSSDKWAEASYPVTVYWAIKIPQTATYAGEARMLQPIPSTPVPS